MFIILLETSGNQRYIFSTNKLRENVGASELTYQIGTRIVVEQIRKDYKYSEDKDGSLLRKLLLAEKPLDSTDKDSVEIIIATSGKALLLTNTKDKAKEIVGYVTKTALETMPGLNIRGAIFPFDDLTDIHYAIGEVHKKLEKLLYDIPSNLQRFQRLPFVEPCATSGLPANEIYRHESLQTKPDELKPHSSLSIQKQITSNQGRNRLEQMLQIKQIGIRLPGNINDLEKKFQDVRWLSIIHADGNGLGEIFLNFKNNSKSTDGRDYINKYRKFSLALDICTINATRKALEELKKKYDEKIKETKDDLLKRFNLKRSQSKKKRSEGKIEEAKKLHKESRKLLRDANELNKLPFIPLVLGGDDLTVICDGEYAIKFTYDFLTEFENQTSQNDLIKSIAKKAFGVERLGICAGIAIIKPHYPFHQAYGLADNLIKSAKLVKTNIKHTFKDENGNDRTETLPSSAMDFHVLYDSSGVELKQIREKLVVDDGKTYLYAKPYILTNETELKKADKQNWLENRLWKELQTRVCAMSDTEKDDEGKRKLPNSQLHHIRESLFRGQKETDSEVNLFKHRYSDEKPEKDKGFKKLLCGDSLFFEQNGENFTHFLDALDVVELWKGFECPKKNSENTKTNGGAK